MEYTKTPQEFYDYLNQWRINLKEVLNTPETLTQAVNLTGKIDVITEIMECCLKETVTRDQQIENIKKQCEFIANAANEIKNMEWE